MSGKSNIPALGIGLILVSLLLILFSSTFIGKDLRLLLEVLTNPIRKFEFSLISKIFAESQNTAYQKLVLENNNLRARLVEQEKLVLENRALRDQFEAGYPPPDTIIPASIIGSPNFIPGLSFPTAFIIDKGQKSGIAEGNACVSGPNLLGVVSKVSENIAKISLISGTIKLTAKTVPEESSEREAQGVVTGESRDSLVFENILLSDQLKVGQTVVTKGDALENGNGMPANLIIGKIESIDKKESSLFQRAKVKPLINFASISTLFCKIR